MDYENRIVDWLNSNCFQLAFVTKQQKNKIQAYDPNGKNIKIKERQILNVQGTTTDQTYLNDIKSLQNEFNSILSEFDLELLWDSVQDVQQEYSISELAELYFGENNPKYQSVVARVIVKNKIFFKRNGLNFSPRTGEEIAQLKAKAEKIAKAELYEKQVIEWLQKLFSQINVQQVPDLMQNFVQQIQLYLFANQRNNAVTILEKFKRKENSKKTAIQLLKKVQLWKDDIDEFLLINGIIPQFSDAIEKMAKQLIPYQPSTYPQQSQFKHVFSIDSADTKEIDDAISCIVKDDKIIVGIHIAAPLEFVKNNDLLDRVALDRALTLYLPTSVVTMLPHHIGCELASLNKDEPKPALSFIIEFDNNGNMQDFSIIKSEITVTDRLTYEEADQMLKEQNSDIGKTLLVLQSITDKLAKNRLEKGALKLVKPEIKIKVKNNKIIIKTILSDNPSSIIVSELMIFANNLAAKFALRNDIPIIYRMQEAPANNIKPMTEYDPITFDNNVKQLKKTRLTTHPQPHSGLGLDLYTQISSPLRRYADLVMQRQIFAFINKQPFPYKTTELIEVLAVAENTEQENRRLERESKKIWLLEYLKQYRKNENIKAIVVRGYKGNLLAEIEETLLRGVLHTTHAPEIGDKIEVVISEINPQNELLVLKQI